MSDIFEHAIKIIGHVTIFPGIGSVLDSPLLIPNFLPCYLYKDWKIAQKAGRKMLYFVCLTPFLFNFRDCVSPGWLGHNHYIGFL